jgi:DNA (cytosine-5)-methyltransferase 1
MDSEITVLDLFSGIGGFSLGLETAGPFRTVAFCEQEPFPQAVLRKHWPGVPIYDDVRTIPTDELGRIDLVCGGFPCQPWSQAGQQRGAEDDRDLWPAMASLIEKLRPQWIIGENVRGFVNEPMGLQRSLSDLESIGYQAVPFIIPACAVDAPHRRDRVWIVAHSRHSNEGQYKSGLQRWRGEHVRTESSCVRQNLPTNRNVANADGSLGEGNKRTKRGEQKRADDCKPRQWLPEPDVGRVAHGIPRRVDRLKGLGNAVVPQVVEQIGRAIIQSHYSID